MQGARGEFAPFHTSRSYLGHVDGLLLHRLMQHGPVVLPHPLELIDAAQPSCLCEYAGGRRGDSSRTPCVWGGRGVSSPSPPQTHRCSTALLCGGEEGEGRVRPLPLQG